MVEKHSVDDERTERMKKVTIAVGLVALALFVVGCAHSTGFNVWKANAGITSRAHAWEEPHFTHDLTNNPVKSEIGLGFVTVGSHAGWSDQEVAMNLSARPEK
ncbi:MAG: hypothetical protein ACXAC5_01020 [Promethearchaeota archaeon]|jgi:hypothetical protein